MPAGSWTRRLSAALQKAVRAENPEANLTEEPIETEGSRLAEAESLATCLASKCVRWSGNQ